MFLFQPFILSFSAAESLDANPGMVEKQTKRMAKQAEKLANPSPSKLPGFLKSRSKGGKRFRDAEGKTKTAFMPSWGICEQDSIHGDSLLSIDWSKCSITPPDMVNVMARASINETEQLGCQAMYQVCVQFTFTFTWLLFLFFSYKFPFV